MKLGYSNKDIPFYTNDNNKAFHWFAHNQYNKPLLESNISFSSISSNSTLHNFGLYGCGFHMLSWLKTGDMKIFGISNSTWMKYTLSYIISKSYGKVLTPMRIIQPRPFHLKGYSYDLNFGESIDMGCSMNTSKYFAGVSGKVQVDNNNFVSILSYFSVDLVNHPTTFAIITKIYPIHGMEYTNSDYHFIYTENDVTNDVPLQLAKLKESEHFKYAFIIRFR